MSEHTSRRFDSLLAATAMGVYLLVVVGTTTALTDAAAACPTWPACNGSWLVALDQPKLAVAWGHRVVALVVALALAVTTILGWRVGTSRRVRAALTAAAVLYPVQVGLGAFAATTATPALLSAVHLVVGMAIFGGVVHASARTTPPKMAMPTRRWTADSRAGVAVVAANAPRPTCTG